MSRAKKRQPCLTYLEALDEEHWHFEKQMLHDSMRDVQRDEYRDALEAYQEVERRIADPADAERKRAKETFDQKEAIYRTAVRGRLHKANRTALCFSGGGIRSATFGLGVLQGLAGNGLLKSFDFLSTVSGGGYLGAWLSAWIQRTSLDEVDEKLRRVPEVTLDPEPQPVWHLRKFSNYLSPKLGATSADTWALASTVIRNMALNWLVLLPMFAAALLIPLFAWRSIAHPGVPPYMIHTAFSLGLLSAAVATAYVGFDLPSGGDAHKSPRWYLMLCLGMLTVSAACLNMVWAWLPATGTPGPWWDIVSAGKNGLAFRHLAVPGMLVHGGGMLVGMGGAHILFGKPPKQRGVLAAVTAAATGALGGWMALLLIQRMPYDPSSGEVPDPRLYAWLGYPTLMFFFMASAALLVGLTSYLTKDEDREWWARSGGWMLAVTIVWFGISGLVMFSVEALGLIGGEISKQFTALTGLTGATGYAAAKAASSESTSSGRRSEDGGMDKLVNYPIMQTIATTLLLPAFVVLLIVLLSATNIHILKWWHGMRVAAGSAAPGSPFVSMEVLALGALYALICLPASYVINVNKFSLHAMYRQRLIRAYLGASNPDRRPHPFTGFDENDNVRMAALASRPFHVVNMALNLVGGDNLAWQQRKAASFTSTRLHTGSCRLGYRPSTDYGGRYKEKGQPISLGTAISISGAAASPNMGYNSSPLLTAVMMLFNARLGGWLGNPRARARVWKKPGPNFGIRAFIDEAFGLTDDKNAWIYLSDGGHFENLGLYEMVSRRCRTIVVSDAGADPGYSYEDLGNAVRKIRIDMAIPIDFIPPRMPMSPERKKTDDYTAHHCAIAKIRYAAVDGDGVEDGTLIYIKPSLNGDEPADVGHYSSTDATFPHQSTADQFFDETQFESYRRLGLHIVERMCGGKAVPTLPEFVAATQDYLKGDA